MRNCRKKEVIEKDWKEYLICNKCWELKEMNSDNFTRDSWAKCWFVYRCKECSREEERNRAKKYYHNNLDKCRKTVRKYREAHREEILRYKREHWDKYRGIREKYLEKNREEINSKNRERTREKWYAYIHVKTKKYINKLWIRPNSCPICWGEWVIVAHHPDYSKWNEITFCCNSCHKYIHQWKITDYKIVDLLA